MASKLGTKVIFRDKPSVLGSALVTALLSMCIIAKLGSLEVLALISGGLIMHPSACHVHTEMGGMLHALGGHEHEPFFCCII